MTGNLQPLDEKFAIVDANGRPTQYFIRWAQQRQIDIQGSVSAAQALAIVEQFLADHPLTAGSGIGLSPSGNIGEDVTISALVQDILDQISTTQGTVLFRGAADWQALAPGTAGQFLQTGGVGANPVWAAAGGGGGTAWTLIAATTVSGTPTFLEYDATGYNEIFGFASAVTTTATSRRSWQVSTNGGVSWLTGATDYTTYSSSGATSNVGIILGTDTDSALARNTLLRLTLDNQRNYEILNRNLNSNIVTGASAKINRIRFGASNTTTLGTTTLTGGTVSVWGR